MSLSHFLALISSACYDLASVLIRPDQTQQWREMTVRMAVISSSKRRQYSILKTRWPSSAVERDGSPDRGFPSVVDEFCLHVKLSPHYSLFVASPHLATSRPGHGVFACLLIAPEDLGNESPWKMSAFGSGFFHENFSQFLPHLPPEKSHISVLFGVAPSPGGLRLSILAPNGQP